MPTNFRINSLLDVLAIKECNTTGVQCGNCDKKSSKSFYCFQCCAFWCEAHCISLHNGIKANKDHRVLALKDFQDKDFENVLKRPAFCSKKHHEKEELKFFCKNCEVAICNTCVLTLHDGHVKITLEEAADERKLQVKSLLESEKQELKLQRNEIATLDERCIGIQEQAATVKRDAEKFVEMMTTLMEAKKKEIFQKVEAHTESSLERIVIRKSEIEHQVKMKETEIEQTETLLKRGSIAEIVQLDKPSMHEFNFFQMAHNRKENYGLLEFHFPFGFTKNNTLMEKLNTEGIGSLLI